ncbi:MAG: peptidoglycan DD-metalloendopeptidase family protein [Solobacterium sp.]|nr:peptidoglycan DD-metalloendopeptidase family protein [Solobacterium sp.]
MKKKAAKTLLAALLAFAVILPVQAEDDFSDITYWTELCTKDQSLDRAQRQSCNAFMEYMQDQSSVLSERVKEIDAKKAEISSNILVYARKVSEYQTQADAMTVEINNLTAEITELNTDIGIKEKTVSEHQAEIEKDEAEIGAAKTKILERIESAQSTMRLNQYLDILMGANSFDDLMRIASGLKDIMLYDEVTIRELSSSIDALNQEKEKLQTEITELASKKETLAAKKNEQVTKQTELLALSYQAQVIEDEFRKQKVDLEAEGNRIAGDIEAIKKKMAEIAEHLREVVAANGFTFPIVGGSLSTGGGTWHYAASFGGGVHLGNDIQCRLGSDAVAIGNGVVLKTADGCGYGYLGNGCGVANGGTWGGGNQLYLLVKINGGLYACKYIHLLAGSFVVQKGDIVQAGQKLAKTGSSGNSTGPHCHFEIYYLGSADNFANYAQNWNGDMAFGCGWGSAALANTCDRNGNKAPCRVRPEDVYGG